MTNMVTARESARNLSLSDLTTTAGDEPRVYDLRLAEALGFARPRAVRQIIERNLTEIERLGPAPRRVALLSRPQGGSVEVTEYWLNEAQALLICMFARTERAAEVRKQVIEVFMAWRRGDVAPKPAPEKPVKKSINELSFLSETHGQIDLTFKKTKDKWKGMSSYETGRSLCAEVIEFAYDNSEEAHMLMKMIPSELMRRNMNEHANGFISKMATYVSYCVCMEQTRPGRKSKK